MYPHIFLVEGVSIERTKLRIARAEMIWEGEEAMNNKNSFLAHLPPKVAVAVYTTQTEILSGWNEILSLPFKGQGRIIGRWALFKQ